MGLIPLPHKVTVRQPAGIDRWGLLTHSEETTHDARIKYEVASRVAGKTTGQPVKNVIPTGSMLVDLGADITHDTELIFTATDGQQHTVIPEKIKHIGDLNAVPLYWKVTF